MKLYLVRHGESVKNKQDVTQGSSVDEENGLTEKGRLQANAIAEFLKTKSFQRFFCSPIYRARETADIISSAIKMPYVLEERLREKSVGFSKGINRKEFLNMYENWDSLSEQERLTYKLNPQEESQLELRNRVYGYLRYLKDTYENDCVLAVSHGGFMRAMYQGLMNISFIEMWVFENCGYVGVEQNRQGDFKIVETHGLVKAK